MADSLSFLGLSLPPYKMGIIVENVTKASGEDKMLFFIQCAYTEVGTLEEPQSIRCSDLLWNFVFL
jgi:hypothetical protein